MTIAFYVFVVGLIISSVVTFLTRTPKKVKSYGCVVVVCFIGFIITGFGSAMEAGENYYANIEIKQERNERKYELLSLEYSNEFQGWTTTGKKGGICLLIVKAEMYSEEGEVIYKEKYQFYYIKDPNTGEVGRMELDVSETRIFLIENDETPYLVETVVQQYEIDNNVDPPTTTTCGDPSITYSLYISRESIAGDIDIAA